MRAKIPIANEPKQEPAIPMATIQLTNIGVRFVSPNFAAKYNTATKDIEPAEIVADEQPRTKLPIFLGECEFRSI